MSKISWLSPSPLWDDLSGGAAFRAPALLRFATDSFMTELQTALDARPDSLRRFVARYETWRKPAAGLPPRGSSSSGPASTETLKLYQPVHGRFYLVTASLACRVPGLPEHTVDLAAGETVTFVLRRIVTGSDGAEREMAWVSVDGATGWSEAPSSAPVTGEERLPMFGSFFDGDDGIRRRLFAGLVPVDRREQYVGGREVTLPSSLTTIGGPGSISLGSGSGSGSGGSSGSGSSSSSGSAEITVEDPRIVDFQRAVLDPWVGLLEWYDQQKFLDDNRRNAALTAAEQAGALLLIDFYDWLAAELPDVRDAVDTPALAGSLPTAQKALYDELNEVGLRTRAPGLTQSKIPAALKNAASKREGIEGMVLTIPSPPPAPGSPPNTAGPAFPAGYVPVLLTGDPRDPTPTVPNPVNAGVTTDDTRLRALLGRDASLPQDVAGVHRRRIVDLLMKAVAEAQPPSSDDGSDGEIGTGEPRMPVMAPLNAQGDDRFVVRCVYARPRCGKNAAPLVSAASERFRLAGFFDPDAPQRPIRVALPIDTTPAGLRKYDRNVAFLLSNELRKQMSRVKGMKELMDGDVGAPGGLDISVICSLSIPIITICALIVLMLMVSLLNIIFWWIPFFITCFPVPTLRAKGGS